MLPLANPAPPPRSMKGTLFAVVALVFVVVTAVLLPVARVFLLISIPIGVVIAVGLYFWNQRPVKLKDDENKRPLGLS